MLKMVSLEEGNWRVMESDSNDVNTDEDEEERMVAGSRTTKAMPPPSLSEIDSECFDVLGLVLIFLVLVLGLRGLLIIEYPGGMAEANWAGVCLDVTHVSVRATTSGL